MRPEIHVGDLTRAVAALEPMDGETLATAREMLGIDVRVIERRRAPEAPEPPRPTGAGATDAGTGDAATEPEAPEPGLADDDGSGEVLGGVLREVLPRPDPVPPDWSLQVRAMQPPEGRRDPAPDPLFAPARRRTSIAAATARWAADGDPDIDRMIDDLAQLRPIVSLPRLRVPTLRRGVQVLVDVSPAMAPYSADCDDIVAGIEELVSADQLELIRFRGCPTRPEESGERSWTPPAAGTGVVLLSDLGIGGSLFDPDRASTQEWLGFADSGARAGVGVLALVPFGRARWPAALAGALTLVHWDSETSVLAIRRAARRVA